MTITLDRPVIIDTPTLAVPAVDIPAAIAAGCPAGVPWCLGDSDWHDADESAHDSEFVILPTGDQACTRHDEKSEQRANEVWLALEREDANGQVGEPTIYLAPNNSIERYAHVEEAHLALDDAEQLAYTLLRLVATARGSKRAADLRIGDVVVIDGVEQTVNLITHDALCCVNRETGVHECAGSLTVETNLSGDCETAATYELDDLVPVRVSE